MQALQARREQREQQEEPEAERQGDQEEQSESGEGRPRIETASAYYRLCPCGAAARPRRALRVGSVSVASRCWEPAKTMPKLVQNRPPEDPKLTPGGSKIDPRGLPGGKSYTEVLLGSFFTPPGAHFGPSWGALGALLGIPERSGEPLGASREAPKWVPGGLPERSRNWETLFSKKRAPASTGARFSRILGAPKWLQNRPKMAPESLPGGLRDPDRAGSPTWRPYFRKKAPALETFVVFSSENKPGYHGTGSA